MQVPVSPETNALLDDATALSVRRGHYFVGVEHLYEAIMSNPSLLPEVFGNRYGDRLKAISYEVSHEAWSGTLPTSGREIFYSPRCAAVTSAAARLADRLSGSGPTAGHLLLAMLNDPYSAPSRALDRTGQGREEITGALRAVLSQRGSSSNASPAPSPEEAQPLPESSTQKTKTRERRKKQDTQKQALDSMTRDLTRAARESRLEPAIGRDREVYQILEILGRKGKNNVILVGDAGVGKTRIIEGLAIRCAERRAQAGISDYRFLELNLAALMAGTQYRGAFEEKLLALLEKLRRSPDVVLFVDEIHLIMGSGSVEGSGMDLANLLKPALARGEIRCVGATTLHEYRKFIERDPALERRFQMVRVEPLSPDDTKEVLVGLKPALEAHHGVRISRRALRASISLTERYMPNRHLPDKAIDVLDQACSRYRLKAVAAKNDPSFLDSDPYRPEEKKVIPHDIRKVVSSATGIPIEDITAAERERLAELEERLSRHVIGQDAAVAKVVAAVKKSRAGLSDPHRPDAVMLFLGPTGVGKTELAKALANHLFGAAQHLVTFDMSEYVEEHSVARLLGAPPGYVGSDQEGRLTTAVRNHPFSLLLFDEIEKAHRRIYDILLPVLDEGRLKDARGRDLDFRHCVIVFTSNIGADTLSRSSPGTEGEDLMTELLRHFRPEFINRVDEIVPFYPLLFEDVRTILQLFVRGLKGRLKAKGIRIRVYQGAYEHLAEQSKYDEFGARDLRRTLDRCVTGPVSEMILAGKFESGDVIEALMHKGQLTFRKGAIEEALV